LAIGAPIAKRLGESLFLFEFGQFFADLVAGHHLEVDR
jgi:hypothetical protein